MKAISIHQPWATLIINGKKTMIAMQRRTSHRGALAIHASETELPDFYFTNPSIQKDLAACCPGLIFSNTSAQLPHKQIVGTVNLTQIFEWDTMSQEDKAIYAKHRDIRIGRYIWIVEKAAPIEPITFQGRRAVFDVNIPEPNNASARQSNSRRTR